MNKNTYDDLRLAYDRSVEERESSTTQSWKSSVRARFLTRLREENKSALLEVGAGTGVHGLFFMEAGLEVVCTDLSSEMVRSCRAKGLVAQQADFLAIRQLQGFDAVFAMNCFLHVPPEDLHEVLISMCAALDDGGLLYWGQYGGVSFQGNLENDTYQPKRYFSMLTDTELKTAGADVFELVEFESIVVDPTWDQKFQSSVWRKRDGSALS